MEKAIEALLILDRDNHVLGRCVDYVRQLEKLINSWSKIPSSIPIFPHVWQVLHLTL